jgi:carboxypeptidase T
MRRCPRSLVLLLSLLVPILASAGPRLVKVPASTAEERARLASLGCEVVACRPDHVVLAVPQEGPIAARAARMLEHWAGVSVVEEDVDRLFRRFRRKDETLGVYHDLAAVKRELDSLATQRPALAQVLPIGTTFEGRDILALRISSPDASPWGRPTFLFMGAHHAREWISVEVPLALARHLVSNADADPTVKEILATREVWIVPVVNPDGLNYSQTQYRYWRKNRRKNADGSFGVDPNRNYGYKWGTAGDSGDPDSDVYRGAGPFSEPCTQAVRDFAVARNLTASISYHSYGETILYPWSYGYDTATDKAVLEKFAKDMAQQNGYYPQQSVELYPSSGDTDDHLYGETGSMSFTTELGSSFIPSEPDVPKICEANLKAQMLLLKNGAEPFPFMVHKPLTGVSGRGPFDLQATFDVAHHPKFEPAEVSLVVMADGQTQEIPMTRSGDGWTFTAQIPRVQALGEVRYFFGLKNARGQAARTPRLTDFVFRVGAAEPPTLFTGAP